MTGPANWDERTQWTPEEPGDTKRLSADPGSMLTSRIVQHQPQWEEALGFGFTEWMPWQ